MDRPLRLISTDTIVGTPIDALARTLEALLVVASQPLSVGELAEAAAEEVERVETALGLVSERYREGRSGIVLERVAGGYAFRAVPRGRGGVRQALRATGRARLSQAALETLAIVAYLGPVSRPEIARIRGVAADSTVASLVERGLVAEAGRESAPGGAVRYRVTPLFERVFALDTLAELPRLDDLGGEQEAIRERLLAVAEARAS